MPCTVAELQMGNCVATHDTVEVIDLAGPATDHYFGPNHYCHSVFHSNCAAGADLTTVT